MGYQLSADLVILAHVGYVLFVLLGQLAILLGAVLRWEWIRNFWFRATHFAMIAVVVFEALLGIVCPLTEWEQQLRAAGGGTVQEGSFIGRLMHNLLFVEVSPTVLTVCYVLFGLLVLICLAWVPPRRPRKKSGGM